MGWRVLDPKDSQIMARAFIELLDEHKVPFRHYGELYKRCVQLRVSRMNQGVNVDDFSAEMMVSCWTTKGGLRDELQQQEIMAARYLPDTTASDCPQCYGTGMYNPDGLGLRNGCEHREIG